MSEKKAAKSKSQTGMTTLIWACLAVCAAGGAYVAVNGPSGQNQIVSLVDTARSSLSMGTGPDVNVQNSNPLEEKIEVLSQAVNRTNARNDELYDRVVMLENALGPFTASLGDTEPGETGALGNAEVDEPQPQMAEKKTQIRIIDTNPANRNDPLIPVPSMNETDETTVSTTEFGLELAQAMSPSDGMAVWGAIRAKHPEILGKLSPRISILETESGQIELRLVAGPVRNAATVAALCAKLRTEGQDCNGTIFEGQKLALR